MHELLTTLHLHLVIFLQQKIYLYDELQIVQYEVTDLDNDPTYFPLPLIRWGWGWGWGWGSSIPNVSLIPEEEPQPEPEEQPTTETTPEQEQEEPTTETPEPQEQPQPEQLSPTVPTTYIPYPNQFSFPNLLPQTGTPLLERTSIIQNPKLNLTPPTWAQPDMSQSKTDISYWKNEVLPYAEDRAADEYIVLPTLWLIAPLNYVPTTSQDYQDIVKDGTQIKDFSYQWWSNYLEYLNGGVMQYPGTLPIGLSAGTNREYTGNTVIFGYSSYWKSNEGKYDTIFWLLPTLDVWEEVWVFTRKNNPTGDYELRRHSIEKSYNTSANDTQILTQEWFDTPHLTLFTCTPIWGIAGRWIVQGKLIEEQTQTQQNTQQNTNTTNTQTNTQQTNTNAQQLLETKTRNVLTEVYQRAWESNRERLTDFLLERLETMREKYEWDEQKMLYLEFLEELVEEMR